ncbi:DUF6445 family protein [Catenovulum sediminis]|uniref:DUF6445 family protein n=1 Tax=Catenovulum sediminis TaxID=1740262 RepID=A0ABV1RLU6_9ALTE
MSELDFQYLNTQAKSEIVYLGEHKTPVILIDNFSRCALKLKQDAIAHNQFKQTPSDYYPGLRMPGPKQYAEEICSLYAQQLNQVFAMQTSFWQSNLCAYSLTTTQPEKLKPIQMLPHFDTANDNQLAVVHYLCDETFGGTAFFRHNSTGYERINKAQLNNYATQLKQQAMAARLHEKPGYLAEQNSLYQKIGQVDVEFNRAVIYPGNLLHSGLIKPALLSDDPTTGRLTLNTFIVNAH